MKRAFLWFFPILFWTAAAQAPPLPIEEIHLTPEGPTQPFPHFWETMFGSGRAVLSLRDDYRRDLRLMKQATGIQTIRFHAIFDDDIGLYDEDAQGRPVYNFSYVDQIYDGLLATGVRPFVEMSFMPRKLSSSDHVHAFWYKPYPNPPKDYAKWENLVYNFASHLIERYGIAEVSQWKFEVWNEPNIDFWTGEPKQATYFTLYDHAAHALKRANQTLQVGGPATAQAAWIEAMIEHSAKTGAPLDFVSTHVYGNDSAKDVFGTSENIGRAEMVARAARAVHDQVKRSRRPDLPIIWSEYNASYMNEIAVTDSAFMGPWLANNIKLCDNLATTMSYWSFSDVFEEQGVIKTPFYGGYGLIAEGGIPKAAFEAFAMLHRLGDRRLPATGANVLATKRGDGTVVLAVWNYAGPGESGPAQQVRVVVDGWPNAKVSGEMLDDRHGSALSAWQAMGHPAWPTQAQYASLRDAAGKVQHLTGGTITVAPHGLAVLEISRQD